MLLQQFRGYSVFWGVSPKQGKGPAPIFCSGLINSGRSFPGGKGGVGEGERYSLSLREENRRRWNKRPIVRLGETKTEQNCLENILQKISNETCRFRIKVDSNRVVRHVLCSSEYLVTWLQRSVLYISRIHPQIHGQAHHA